MTGDAPSGGAEGKPRQPVTANLHVTDSDDSLLSHVTTTPPATERQAREGGIMSGRMVQPLDTMRRRIQLRMLSNTVSGRARLKTMLETHQGMVASLDTLRAQCANLPDDTRERETLRRNIAAIERALGRLSA